MSDLIPPVEYALTVRSGVWALRRNGRLLMRSRDERRVRNAWQSRAIAEAITTNRPVIASEDAGDGQVSERTWTPESARDLVRASREMAAFADRLRGLAREAGMRFCRVCGCTDDDCSLCVERTGEPCHWVEADLCSACQGHEGVIPS